MDAFHPLKTPLRLPTPGQQSNLIDGESIAWMPRVAIYTTLPVAVCFVALRVFVRLRQKHVLGWDDYLCVLSMCVSIAFCGMLLEQVLDETIGRHYWDLPVAFLTSALMKKTLAVTTMYQVSAAATKFSLLALFLRIFGPSRQSRLMCWAGIIFTAVSYTALLAAWIACTVPGPHEASWTDKGFRVRTTRQTPGVSVTLGVVSIVTDFYIIAIPLTAVARLNLSRARKIALSALFAVGLLACALSVAGTYARIEGFRASVVRDSPDPFWLAMSIYALGIAEINLGIICASVPVVAPLLKGFVAQLSNVTSSWRRYLPARSSPSADVTETAPSGDVDKTPPTPRRGNKSLLSFGRSSGRQHKPSGGGEIVVTRDTKVHAEPGTELRSIDMDYHGYLGTRRDKASHTAYAKGG